MNPPSETPTPPDWLEEVLDAISCTDGVDAHRWNTDEKGKITVDLDYGNETLSFEADTDGEMHGASFDNVIYDMTNSEAVQFWCAGELYTRLQKAKEPKPCAVRDKDGRAQRWHKDLESLLITLDGIRKGARNGGAEFHADLLDLAFINFRQIVENLLSREQPPIEEFIGCLQPTSPNEHP